MRVDGSLKPTSLPGPRPGLRPNSPPDVPGGAVSRWDRAAPRPSRAQGNWTETPFVKFDVMLPPATSRNHACQFQVSPASTATAPED